MNHPGAPNPALCPMMDSSSSIKMVEGAWNRASSNNTCKVREGVWEQLPDRHISNTVMSTESSMLIISPLPLFHSVCLVITYMLEKR